jgi:signal transduction histidine kinase/ABC-type phosphate/phosphonate transport system substrate-binding protein
MMRSILPRIRAFAAVAVSLLLPFSGLASAAGPASSTQAANTTQEISIAVLSIRGVDLAYKMWTPTAEYLSRQIPGYHFSIQPLSINSIGSVVKANEADFVLANPALYAELEASYGISRIATLRNRRRDGAQTQFGALIIARADRDDISDLNSLRGKSFMAVHPHAFGGWWMAWRKFKQAGIDPEEDFSRLEFSGFPQDNVVIAVRDGKVDAGTIRTDILERMAADGKINLSDFKIIDAQKTPGFPYAHSTRLYPEWPFATTRSTRHELAQQVAIALLSLPADSPEAQAASSEGWTVPLNYQPVQELMKELRVGPYTTLGKVTLRDALLQHWQWFIAFVTTLVISIVTTAYSLYITQKFRHSKNTLEHEIGERQRAEAAEHAHAERIRSLYEASSMPGKNTEQRIDEILRLGCRVLDMEVGKVVRINPDTETNTVINIVAPEPHSLKPGSEWDLDGSFCSLIYREALPMLAINDVSHSGYKQHLAHVVTGIEAYIGFPILTSSKQFWTISFASPRPHPAFAETDIDLVKLMGRWISAALNRLLALEKLERAKENAELSNRAKSDFLTNMTHELRTPLNAIIGFSELLREEFSSHSQSQYREDLDKIHTAGTHLLSLINTILDLSSLEAEQVAVHIDGVQVNDFVAGVLKDMRATISSNGNELINAVTDDVGILHTDLLKLRQVMRNLLSNAAKFTHSGKITVSADRESLGGKDVINIHIADTGIGIEEKEIAHLFQPFTQVDQSWNRQFGGTGLGLAISQRFCQLLGGKILVQSTPGEGSIFTIQLPDAIAQEAAQTGS